MVKPVPANHDQLSVCTRQTDNVIALRFEKAGDRFVQQLVWLAGQSSDRPVSLLHSLDQVDQDITSPPLQEVVVETHSEFPVLLAVGQANKNHWSGSIGTNADGSTIEFDFACRVNSSTDVWLGSTWQIDPECPVVSYDDRHVKFESSGTQFSLQTDTNSNLDYDPAQRTITIRPTGTIEQVPATVVWKYSVFQIIPGSLAGSA